MQITVFRYGHRIVRDKRVTTHCALVSRALGAKEMIYCGQEDNELFENIRRIDKKFGSDFKITYVDNYIKKLEELKKDNILVHLTMYGQNIVDTVKQIKLAKTSKGIVLIVGSQKVPVSVYHISDYNASVTNQPHSEIAALAITLDRLNPNILNDNEGFSDAKVKLVGDNDAKRKVKMR